MLRDMGDVAARPTGTGPDTLHPPAPLQVCGSIAGHPEEGTWALASRRPPLAPGHSQPLQPWTPLPASSSKADHEEASWEWSQEPWRPSGSSAPCRAARSAIPQGQELLGHGYTGEPMAKPTTDLTKAAWSPRAAAGLLGPDRHGRACTPGPDCSFPVCAQGSSTRHRALLREPCSRRPSARGLSPHRKDSKP